MILDTDEQIKNTIRDNFPITIDELKSLGWKYVSCCSINYGGYYIHWTIWVYCDSYIELYEDGRCRFKQSRLEPGSLIKTVKELRKHMYSF